MDVVIASRVTKSCLSSSCKSSDYVLKLTETSKFGKDRRSCNPIFAYATTRFIPLALSHLDLRGPRFQVVLKDFATILVTIYQAGGVLSSPCTFRSHSFVRELVIRFYGLGDQD